MRGGAGDGCGGFFMICNAIGSVPVASAAGPHPRLPPAGEGAKPAAVEVAGLEGEASLPSRQISQQANPFLSPSDAPTPPPPLGEGRGGDTHGAADDAPLATASTAQHTAARSAPLPSTQATHPIADTPPWDEPPSPAPSSAAPIALPEPSANNLILPVLPQAEPGAAFRPQPEAATAPARSARLVPTELGDIWHELAQALCAQGALTGIPRELLLQSQLMQQEPAAQGVPARWVLRVENESLNHESSRLKLVHALREHTGQPLALHLEFGRVVDCPAMRLAAARAERQHRAEAAFASHPLVQAMMRDFGAQPLPGSIAFAEPASPDGGACA